METYQIEPVGYVVNDFDDPGHRNKIKESPSTILLYDRFTEGLLNIEACAFLDIVYYLHKSEGGQMSGRTPSGDVRGAFASRSPARPNPIGITTVKLLVHDHNKLLVKGLDAINGSPVIDIKCCDTSLFAAEMDSDPVHNSILKSDPRIEIRNHIAGNRTEILMLKAGQMHGHFCPGLAMGIMAATWAMNELSTDSDGMEDLLSITETNNCFSDGVQFVTGCSFGNNALIFKDTGKTAFTLAKRDGNGIRICSKPGSRKVIQEAFPDYQRLFETVVAEQDHDPALVAEYKKSSLERAFGTLSLPLDKLFRMNRIQVDIPAYAPVHESIVCSVCGESVMDSRIVCQENRPLCADCAKTPYSILTGDGIRILSHT
ncbi:MAG: SAM-dependent methyltransferase [Bacteroidales bacterium]|nr:SAM-dependent methyltransferase [Bacteroidales bacterium]